MLLMQRKAFSFWETSRPDAVTRGSAWTPLGHGTQGFHTPQLPPQCLVFSPKPTGPG